MTEGGLQSLQVNSDQVAMGEVKTRQADLDISKNLSFDGVGATSARCCAATAREQNAPRIVAINREALTRIVEDEPAGLIVHLRTKKDETVRNQFDGNVQRRIAGRKAVRRRQRRRSLSEGSLPAKKRGG